MKRIVFAMMAASLGVAAAAYAGEAKRVVRLSEPVEVTAEAETFGSPMDLAVPAVSLAQVAGDGGRYAGEPVRVEARVSQVCQKKGCFFIAREGDAVVRVSFEDYSFFVPTDISGRRVTLVGRVVAREVTPEQAAHFAEDLGQAGAPMEPGIRWEIVATSVRVPRG